MKKLIIAVFFVIGFFATSSAQVEGKAIGARFGLYSGYGAELTYLHPLSQTKRLEVDLGINHYGFGLNGVYQWVWDLSAITDGFNWYAGLGGGISAFDYDRKSPTLGLCGLGQVGVEYNFQIPLQLSLDYRPSLYLMPSTDGFHDGVCFSVRYRFH